MTEGLKSAITSVSLYQIFTPLALRALPPISFYDEQRERIENGISRFGTKIALYPSPLSHDTTGYGWGDRD